MLIVGDRFEGMASFSLRRRVLDAGRESSTYFTGLDVNRYLLSWIDVESLLDCD